MSFKLSDYVKLNPWLQFVSYVLLIGILLSYLTGHHGFFIGAPFALAIGFVEYLRQMPRTHPLLRFGGYALITIGLVLVPFHVLGVWLTYLGVGVGLAGFDFEILYP